MKEVTIDLFMPVSSVDYDFSAFDNLVSSGMLRNVYLWSTNDINANNVPEYVKFVKIVSLHSSDLFFDMSHRASSDMVLCILKDGVSLPTVDTLKRLSETMNNDNSVLSYTDCYKIVDGLREKASMIDYQIGSLRDDFDFGSLLLIRTSALKIFLAENKTLYKYAGFYQMRLALSRLGSFTHFKEYAYEEYESDKRSSGEKQFDYVNPSQREVQIEMECVCTEHLKFVGAYLPPYKYDEIDVSKETFPVEASVVIPVFNRKTTIGDAINSALNQKTDFLFNVIVVDNHSDDGTSDIIDRFKDERVIHLVPESRKLGIGGCWNYAINNEACGRFAVQLDSDDLYSDSETLQRIVNGFYKEQCAMLIGSYRICDFNLKTLPPGVIDHKEWSEENGRNNALRINGLGAPRAFYTPVIRHIGFPNVSYGEDYAVGLQISRRYRIGRIYDVLYLCRRWAGNSDAKLTRDKVNLNNFYKDSLRSTELTARMRMMKKWNRPDRRVITAFFDKQLSCWDEVAVKYKMLNSVKTKVFSDGIRMQYNPERVKSAVASVDKKSISERPCFLCANNRCLEQKHIDTRLSMEVLVNPYPIFSEHYTIVTKKHLPQMLSPMFSDMLFFAKRWRGMALFYNGAKCGASAPDHSHLQAVRRCNVPILSKYWIKKIRSAARLVCGDEENGLYFSDAYIVPLFVIQTKQSNVSEQFMDMLMKRLPCKDGDREPAMNVISCYSQKNGWITIVFPRSKHRPDCYFYTGDTQHLISPGALDMAGVLVVARKEDYDVLTAENVFDMIREVAFTVDECLNIVNNWN